MGSVTASPLPDEDGLLSGSVTIEATPATGCDFAYWLVGGANNGNANLLSLTMNAHTTVRAMFARLVMVSSLRDTSGSASTAGTLRYALTNAGDADIIQFSPGLVTVGTSVIELTGRLPDITKSITIEGNGVTLTRAGSWDTVDEDSQLLYVADSYATDITVNISRVHFKDGKAEKNGAAIYVFSGTLNLESCIFSGNQTTYASASGGAISANGTLTVKGCTLNRRGERSGSMIGKFKKLRRIENLY